MGTKRRLSEKMSPVGRTPPNDQRDASVHPPTLLGSPRTFTDVTPVIPFVLLEGALSDVESERLLTHVEANRLKFVPATVASSRFETSEPVIDRTHRRAAVLTDIGDIGAQLRDAAFSNVPWLCGALGIPAFVPTKAEALITATGSGDFFRRHNDCGYPCETRVLTFVYYFGGDRLKFEGGELRLYFGPRKNGESRDFVVIHPRKNRFLVFPSVMDHELRPTQCPSDDVLDRRLTLNGWIHR